MMKTIEFKQNDLKRGIPFAIIYCVAVFASCYFYLGGIIGMADAVNNIGSAKASGLLIGLVVLVPFIIILTVMMPKVKVELGLGALSISSSKDQKQIAYSEIYTLRLNMVNLNRLDILDQQNNVLAHIKPQSKPEVLTQIINEISKQVNFTKQTGSKNYFGTTIQTALYVRQK